MRKISEMIAITPAGGRLGSGVPVVADEKTVFFLAERAIKKLYGDRGKTNLVPRMFRSERLYISCSGPLWANELWVGKDALLGLINTELGRDGVRDIKVSD